MVSTGFTGIIRGCNRKAYPIFYIVRGRGLFFQGGVHWRFVFRHGFTQITWVPFAGNLLTITLIGWFGRGDLGVIPPGRFQGF